MRRDGDDGDLACFGTVAPKYTVSPGRAVLHIRLEHLRAAIVGIFDGVVFVRIQAWVTRIFLKQQHALYDLLEQPFLPGGFLFFGLLPVIQRLSGCCFKLVKGIRCAFQPNQCEGHQSSSCPASFSAFFISGGFFATLPLRA